MIDLAKIRGRTALTSPNLWLVAMTGIFSAPHCIGMCGGIVSSFALNASGSAIWTVISYNLGRVLTYTVLGGIMGSIGSFVNTAGNWVGFQGIASIVGGVMILLWVLRKIGLPLHRWSPTRFKRIQQILKKYQEQGDVKTVFISGILFGFIPCGLTYAMQMNAAASGSIAGGASIMAVFGLSTIPSLLAVGLVAVWIGRSFRSKMMTIGNILSVVIGVIAILRGCAANGWIDSLHPWLW